MRTNGNENDVAGIVDFIRKNMNKKRKGMFDKMSVNEIKIENLDLLHEVGNLIKNDQLNVFSVKAGCGRSIYTTEVINKLRESGLVILIDPMGKFTRINAEKKYITDNHHLIIETVFSDKKESMNSLILSKILLCQQNHKDLKGIIIYDIFETYEDKKMFLSYVDYYLSHKTYGYPVVIFMQGSLTK